MAGQSTRAMFAVPTGMRLGDRDLGRVRRGSLPAVLATVLAVLAACEPVGRYRALGVSRDPGGRVQVHYGSCVEEHVERVQLFRFRGEVLGDYDDDLLWEIVGDAFRRVDVFTVGVAPEGFDETVRLRAGIPFQRRLGVKVYSDQTRGETQTFTLAAIPPGVVYARGQLLDQSGFEELTQRACDSLLTY